MLCGALKAVESTVGEKQKKKSSKRQPREWRCMDYCCLTVGYMCTAWWLLLFLYHCLPTALPGFQVPEAPGVRLRREGLTALSPGCFGARHCHRWLRALGRPLCWLEHLTLHNQTGLDPPGIRVRAVPGLVAADYFAPGYFVWAVLIENLARIGYEGKNLYMAAYDWRLSFQNTEVSRLLL
ncbi:putative phospholipid:diacylglycerol acyltransferase 2 [Vitis vinifera]|uniref:Putative phospholipid:diacylglycerol acyltransferase 2 n=1 Tax=Vitis vinifera TaxID=29760 RepID=A0A438KG30_VITVI|nr:putative phospholipid:diacylglycerol acyltransferase 2 [Vitis vinifera]